MNDTQMLNKTPYLEELKSTPQKTKTAMEWARYLGQSFGTNGALASLRYYRELGWISSDVYRNMIDRLHGLSDDELREDKNSAPDVAPQVEDLANTVFDDHIESLWYIAKLSDDDLITEAMHLKVTDREIE